VGLIGLIIIRNKKKRRKVPFQLSELSKGELIEIRSNYSFGIGNMNGMNYFLIERLEIYLCMITKAN
jgi:hypothetical protein